MSRCCNLDLLMSGKIQPIASLAPAEIPPQTPTEYNEILHPSVFGEKTK